MSAKHERHPGPNAPLNEARAEDATELKPVPAPGGAPAAAPPPAEDDYLHRTVPCQQNFAQAFLAGKAPGLQQRYAPDAKVSDVEGWVEDDQTVEELRRFREECPYG